MFEKTFSFWRRIVGGADTPTADTPSTGESAQEDRRLWTRRGTDVRGTVQLAEQDQSEKIPALIRDISEGGANLLVDRPYQPGHMLRLELPASAEGIRTVLACVVRVLPAPDSQWSLGCVFSRELSQDDLVSLGARKEQATDADLRRWVRFKCEVTAAYRKVGDPQDRSCPAAILNISANGIGFTVPPPLDTGSLLNVDLTDKQGGVRTILACVVHTTLRLNGELAVGCNFIRELSEDELQSLL